MVINPDKGTSAVKRSRKANGSFQDYLKDGWVAKGKTAIRPFSLRGRSFKKGDHSEKPWGIKFSTVGKPFS